MATYQELRALSSDSDLIEKVQTAVVIGAHALAIAASPTAAEKAWVAGVLSDPVTAANQATLFVLAANESLTVAQIQAASDSAVQTEVDKVIPILVDAAAGV